MTTVPDQTKSFRTPKLWWVFAILTLPIALYGWRYAALGERAYVPNLAESFNTRPWAIFVHTLFGPLALLCGVVQFLPAMRKPGRWAVHRIAAELQSDFRRSHSSSLATVARCRF